MKSLLFFLLALGTMAAAGPARADAGLRADRATATLDAVLAGDGEAATHHFNDTLKSALPPAQITGIVEALRQQVGTVGDRGPLRQGCEAGRHTVWQRIQFESAALDAKLVFDDEDRIGGLFFGPPQNETPCADAAAQSGESATPQAAVARDARENDVVVGVTDWPLPAILTVPEGDGPFPAVVLVHGSGPHDADETVFANKPFRDIAHGLADRGVASLRYVKRSKAHGARMTSETPAFGVDDEVTDDAVAAMDWLAGQERIDGERLVVVGHSLGALLAPRICQRSRACAGLIMLAAPTRPLEELVLDQVRYLAPHQGISAEQIHSVEKQVADIARLRNGEVVEGPLMLGLSADYWRSITRYDAVATARAVDRPILVLQGERDYQVTMADFAGWRDGLAGRQNTQLKSYPVLDHLFMSGTGASLPDDYMQPGHVEMQVIDDMALWIGARRADREERAR